MKRHFLAKHFLASLALAPLLLLASLGVWPGWIERHFTALLDAAGRLIATS